MYVFLVLGTSVWEGDTALKRRERRMMLAQLGDEMEISTRDWE